MDAFQESRSLQEEREDSKLISNYERFILRQVRVFRLRYLCSISFKNFTQYIDRRLVHGKAVYISLLLIFLERFAYASVTGNITGPFLKNLHIPTVYQSLIQITLFDMVAQVMFPLAGFLGDRFLGRFRIVHISMWLLFVGYILLTFVSSFEDNSDDNPNVPHPNRELLPICFILVAIGSAGFQANMIPLGADQIIGRPSDEISAYFYWYYWARNLGYSIVALTFTCSFRYNITVFSFIAVVSTALGLIVIQFTWHWLYIDKSKHNPLKLVLQVVKFAINKERPKFRSAFSFTGIEAPSKMDLAKEIHGGKFTNVEVEDVKTFLRLMVFLASLIGVLVVYSGVTNVIVSQTKYTNGSFRSIVNKDCVFQEQSVWIGNIVLIVLAIPCINFLMYPLLREYAPNMLKRIGLGHFLSLLSPLSLLIVSAIGFKFLQSMRGNAVESCLFNEDTWKDHGELPVSHYYVLLAQALMSLAEIFIMVSSLEFFYAQSPHEMRGMMIGLFFLTWGIATLISNLIVVFFSQVPLGTLPCGVWYYILLVLSALLSLITFTIVAIWYKNRKRGDIEPDLYYRRHQYS